MRCPASGIVICELEQNHVEPHGRLWRARLRVDHLMLMPGAMKLTHLKKIVPKLLMTVMLKFIILFSLLEVRQTYCVAQIPKKPVREKLTTEEGAAAARLSKKLVKLQTSMDLPPLR